MNLVDAGIKFTSIPDPGINFGTIIGNKRYRIKNDETGEIYKTRPLINAIDIDWNGFQLSASDAVYSTTGELIALLDSINNKVITLDNSVAGQLTELTTIVGGIEDRVSTLETNHAAFDIRLTALEDLVENLDVEVDPDEIRALIREILPSDMLTVSQLRSDAELRDLIRGESAYDIACRIGGAGFQYNSENEWIASLNGTNGVDGESAYEIAKRLAGDSFIYESEQDWIDSLHGYADEQLATKQDKLAAGAGILITEIEGQQPVIEFSGWTRLNN